MSKRKELYERETIHISNPPKKQKMGSLLSSFPRSNNDDNEVYKHFVDEDNHDTPSSIRNMERKEIKYHNDNTEEEDKNNNNMTTIVPIESAIIHCFHNIPDKEEKTNEPKQIENKFDTFSESFWSIEITGAGGQRCYKNKYKTEDGMKRQLSKEIALMYRLGFKFVQRLEPYFYLFERLDLKKYKNND